MPLYRATPDQVRQAAETAARLAAEEASPDLPPRTPDGHNPLPAAPAPVAPPQPEDETP